MQVGEKKSKKKSMRERRLEKMVLAQTLGEIISVFMIVLFQAKEEARKASAADNAELQVRSKRV
jgi:hypothetical protein